MKAYQQIQTIKLNSTKELQWMMCHNIKFVPNMHMSNHVHLTTHMYTYVMHRYTQVTHRDAYVNIGTQRYAYVHTTTPMLYINLYVQVTHKLFLGYRYVYIAICLGHTYKLFIFICMHRYAQVHPYTYHQSYICQLGHCMYVGQDIICRLVHMYISQVVCI